MLLSKYLDWAFSLKSRKTSFSVLAILPNPAVLAAAKRQHTSFKREKTRDYSLEDILIFLFLLISISTRVPL